MSASADNIEFPSKSDPTIVPSQIPLPADSLLSDNRRCREQNIARSEADLLDLASYAIEHPTGETDELMGQSHELLPE